MSWVPSAPLLPGDSRNSDESLARTGTGPANSTTQPPQPRAGEHTEGHSQLCQRHRAQSPARASQPAESRTTWSSKAGFPRRHRLQGALSLRKRGRQAQGEPNWAEGVAPAPWPPGASTEGTCTCAPKALSQPAVADCGVLSVGSTPLTANWKCLPSLKCRW